MLVLKRVAMTPANAARQSFGMLRIVGMLKLGHHALQYVRRWSVATNSGTAMRVPILRAPKKRVLSPRFGNGFVKRGQLRERNKGFRSSPGLKFASDAYFFGRQSKPKGYRYRGTTPSRPTLTRAVSRVPSGFFAALRIVKAAPAFRSLLSPIS
jgi:hypothetical protein